MALVESLGFFDQCGVFLGGAVFQSCLGADIQGTRDKRGEASGDISDSAEKTNWRTGDELTFDRYIHQRTAGNRRREQTELPGPNGRVT